MRKKYSHYYLSNSSISAAACDFRNADILFLLDNSSTISKTNFASMMKFTKQVIKRLDIDTGNTKIALATFDDSINILADLKTYKTKLDILNDLEDVEAMSDLQNYKRNVFRIARLKVFVKKKGDRPNAENIVITITDGLQEENVNTFIRGAKQNTAKGFRQILITVGLPFNHKIMQSTSKDGNESKFILDTFEQLQNIPDQLFASCKGIIGHYLKQVIVKVLHNIMLIKVYILCYTF